MEDAREDLGPASMSPMSMYELPYRISFRRVLALLVEFVLGPTARVAREPVKENLEFTLLHFKQEFDHGGPQLIERNQLQQSKNFSHLVGTDLVILIRSVFALKG